MRADDMKAAADFYPANYAQSRERFFKAANTSGAQLFRYPIESKVFSDLTVDVAVYGPADAPATVISSGLHGVEAPVGAAVQLALMDMGKCSRSTKKRCVLIHALNPYGYAMWRRVDEDNVDLNRNFLMVDGSSEITESDEYRRAGASGYSAFNTLLNPPHAPRKLDSFLPQALVCLALRGKQELQESIVTGQYQFPQGLFFGGHGACQIVQLLHENLGQWIADAPRVCHLDLHTGLGRFGKCQLLVQASPKSAEYLWFEDTLGAGELVSTEIENTRGYTASGAMGDWLKCVFSDRPYYFTTAEYGTYSGLQVLRSLRAENQAFHYAPSHEPVYKQAKMRLRECFCPPSMQWRSTVLTHAVATISKTL